MLEENVEIMKAIVLNNTCSPDELKVSEVNIPSVKPDWILVKVLGFGINRAEIILRDYEADEDYIKLPVIPGIECVGEVVNPSNTNFKKGDNVLALMGGMGRSFNGSYAEYALLPSKNVFKINRTDLNLEEIIAIPETYFTAYGSLKTLNLKKEDTLLIRGATSSVGIAANQLASVIGCKIITSSRGDSCDVVDNGNLEDKVKCDKILELIGPATLQDSMNCLNENGICCVTGVLGGVEFMAEFDPIKTIPNNTYLTSFFSNYPTQEIIDAIFDFITKYNIKPKIAKVFTSLDDVGNAHKLMESNQAHGKIIFKLHEE